MKFVDLIKPHAIKVLNASSSKKRLLHEVADLAANAHGINAANAVEALMERENLGPTGVGHGVALPHARVSGLEDVVGVFILLEKPLDFDSVDRQPVDVIFGLFAPEEAGVEHLKALALVSRTLREERIRAKLRANRDTSTLYAILTEGSSEQAA